MKKVSLFLLTIIGLVLSGCVVERSRVVYTDTTPRVTVYRPVRPVVSKVVVRRPATRVKVINRRVVRRPVVKVKSKTKVVKHVSGGRRHVSKHVHVRRA